MKRRNLIRNIFLGTFAFIFGYSTKSEGAGYALQRVENLLENKDGETTLAENNRFNEQIAETKYITSFEYYGLIPNNKKKSSYNRTKIREALSDIKKKSGGYLIVPDKTYYIDITDGEAFTLFKGITLQGISREKSIIQLVCPKGRYFSAVSLQDSAKIQNLTLKDDKTNNQQPSTVGTKHQDNQQALIEMEGLNVNIENCDLYNSSTWCVYSDDSAKIPDSRRDYVTIKNCRNYWQKRSIYSSNFDISQIYCKVDNMLFENNEFYTDEPLLSRTVFDLNGSIITIKNNKTYNYAQPLLVGGEFWDTDKVNIGKQIIVQDNFFDRCKIGILLYPQSGKDMENIFIEKNIIMVDVNKDNGVWDQAATLIAGISVEPNHKGIIRNLHIRSNKFEWVEKDSIKTDLGLIGAINLYNGIAGGYHLYDAFIEGNTIKNFPSMGISLGAYPGSTKYKTNNICVSNNLLIDNGNYNNLKNDRNIVHMAYNDVYFSHIFLVMSNMYNVEIKNNTILDTGKKEINGVYWLAKMDVEGEHKNISIGDNNIRTYFNTSLGTNIFTSDFNDSFKNMNMGIVFQHETPIKYCKDIKKDIINYNSNDILITNNGIFQAEEYGTTGSLSGVKIVSKKNECLLEVSEGTKLQAGNVISFGTGNNKSYARILYVKENLVRVNNIDAQTLKVGDPITFFSKLNSIDKKKASQ